MWDAVDHQFFRPLTQALRLETAREAINVNSLDEVPDSSWYTNRLSRRRLTADEVARGPCTGEPDLDPTAIWTVISGKPGGWAPGFVARGPDGKKYLFKADGGHQSEQPTAADTIGSRIYWAAGYFTPCNRIVRIRREAIRLDPGATYEDSTGHRHPMRTEHLESVFARATRYPDGTYRFGTSLYVAGRPLGPFRYYGLREDDPNDVVPHEDRRDLRGARLISAWLNHFDSREQNTLTTWIQGPQGGHVRHWLIDFADCLGGIWPIDGMSRRMGHSYYFDLQHIIEDWLTLGWIPRPWDRAHVHPDAWPFGYFSSQDFDPETWRGGYPNPAYDRMTERDGAWMARILARLTDAHLRAVVAEAKLSYPPWEEYLVRTLAARRDRILTRYLTRLSPLADFTVEGDDLCANDRAIEGRVYSHARYTARWQLPPRYEYGPFLRTDSDPTGRICVHLQRPVVPDPDTPPDAPSRYRIVEIVTVPDRFAPSRPLRVHLYDLGPSRGWALAGIER